MPGPFGNQASGKWIELQFDLIFLFPGMRAETSAQQFADREISRAPKASRGQAHIAHPRQGKSAELPALEIVPKKYH